ncbi:hypothetical protein BDP55DRAFT_647705 [Colletotrichum godetiae]|uniref:Uncharacterized protein n=1 Tax=Colletotrichum godetiae TaxID=1209918 RepID=A0AAJ0EY20_9PEZI|nr:uncharacterized protein BDP55DRAFT_647705 [Colletotrichum godetiae]KAK1691674.1 hypothetical protein BDP55DRAFT_647705 [Colletotrichum godetiae]
MAGFGSRPKSHRSSGDFIDLSRKNGQPTPKATLLPSKEKIYLVISGGRSHPTCSILSLRTFRVAPTSTLHHHTGHQVTI